MSYKKYIKVSFIHDAFEEDSVETAWAYIENGEYILDNILFYAREFAIGDSLQLELIDGMHYVIGLLKESGHSTVRLLFSDASMVSDVRTELEELGCASELSNIKRLLSVDIPTNVSYHEIEKYLQSGLKKGIWEYEEACISEFHRGKVE